MNEATIAHARQLDAVKPVKGSPVSLAVSFAFSDRSQWPGKSARLGALGAKRLDSTVGATHVAQETAKNLC